MKLMEELSPNPYGYSGPTLAATYSRIPASQSMSLRWLRLKRKREESQIKPEVIFNQSQLGPAINVTYEAAIVSEIFPKGALLMEAECLSSYL